MRRSCGDSRIWRSATATRCWATSNLAEDVAQEAFASAYRDLPKLREPAAFPGWCRTIVFKHCDRLTRRKRIATVALDAADDVVHGDDPAEIVERRAVQAQVAAAIQALPEQQRAVVAL